jgi:two-component system chemotaxis sensor kinase CheA
LGKEVTTQSVEKEENMDPIIEKLRETFREEAYELIAELESALLELEKNPSDMEQVGRVFRAMHTIKGSGASCEFHDIAGFTHELETAFDLVRKGKIPASKEIIDLALTARDQIQSMFDVYYENGSADDVKASQILDALKKLLPSSQGRGQGVAPSSPLPTSNHHTPQEGKNVTYRIRFRPPRNIFSTGTNPLMLLEELRLLGPCRIVAQTEAIPYLEDYQSDECYTFWDIILTTNRGKNAIEDLFIFVKDASELSIDVIDEEGSIDSAAMYKKLGEILLDRGDLSQEDLQKALDSKKRVGEVLVERGIVTCEKIESALIEQQHVREIREQRQGAAAETGSSIRVPTSRLDSLVNLVGELVTVQARLSQTALMHGIPQFLSIAEEVERLTVSLRDNTMNIRMLPIGTTFSKFKRVVRDLSAELGKEIKLTAEGADTELDKTVIERLSDPLVHLIRNCIDHGIEAPDVREAASKPRTGTIHLSAVHSGPNVLIQISDDGAGLDTDAIRQKAVEKGLIAPDATPTDKELFAQILMPDFSTAKRVTNVSGRGVGLDVVKKAIDALRGTIEITSVFGKGATITLKLPLTLAIIDGFLTRIGSDHFIFELSSVQECIELKRETAQTSGRNLVNVRGSIVPFIRLRDQFNVEGEAPAIEQIVIVQEDDHRVGFAVDTVIGEHQTVLKSLGKYYRGVEGISGATILGDGTVALILDIPQLIRMVEQQEAQLVRGGEAS